MKYITRCLIGLIALSVAALIILWFGAIWWHNPNSLPVQIAWTALSSIFVGIMGLLVLSVFQK